MSTKTLDKYVAIYERAPMDVKKLISACRRKEIYLGPTQFLKAVLELTYPIPQSQKELNAYFMLAGIRRKP